MANPSSIEDPAAGKAALLGQTTRIAAAYMANNRVAASDISALLHTVHSALVTLGQPNKAEAPAPLTPAVPVRRSVTPDYLVCLEDGKKLKMLKRHLRSTYGMTPDQYRAKWGLPADYPMVAPNYAAARSELAKQLGLGQKRRSEPVVEAQPEPVQAEPAPTKAPARGRRKKAA
jgi:predicted transcriptional regulator